MFDQFHGTTRARSGCFMTVVNSICFCLEGGRAADRVLSKLPRLPPPSGQHKKVTELLLLVDPSSKSGSSWKWLGGGTGSSSSTALLWHRLFLFFDVTPISFFDATHGLPSPNTARAHRSSAAPQRPGAVPHHLPSEAATRRHPQRSSPRGSPPRR